MPNNDTHLCGQAETLGFIKASLENLEERAALHDSREERMLTALEGVAVQGKSIEFIVTNIAEIKGAQNESFQRLRALESPIEKDPFALQIWKSPAGIYVMGLFVVTSLVTAIADFETVKAVWIFFKG